MKDIRYAIERKDTQQWVKWNQADGIWTSDIHQALTSINKDKLIQMVCELSDDNVEKLGVPRETLQVTEHQIG